MKGIDMKAAGVVGALCNPNFFVDVFFDAKNSLDVPRTQMFAWTIVVSGVYLVQVFRSLG